MEATIQAVQKRTHKAADATEVITKTVDDIDHVSAAIASAMEQQKAATSEISRSIDLAARATLDAASHTGRGIESARATNGVSEEMLRASVRLSRLAEALLAEVSGLIRIIRKQDGTTGTTKAPHRPFDAGPSHF